mmetsp:Transcript_36914/g.88435  ORF Transcript_36914/g.88435 Transcript_36914/m.88435 type:complete len:124 (-) Transcript_36914:255-626(-)
MLPKLPTAWTCQQSLLRQPSAALGEWLWQRAPRFLSRSCRWATHRRHAAAAAWAAWAAACAVHRSRGPADRHKPRRASRPAELWADTSTPQDQQRRDERQMDTQKSQIDALQRELADLKSKRQ